MNEARGTVIELDGEYAWVCMDETGCGHCHEVGGCGGLRLEKIFCNASDGQHGLARYRVHNPDKAQPGERVTVTMPAGALGRSAVRAYGLPLLALFVGAFGGLALAGEAGAMAGAGLGLLAGGFVLPHLCSLRPAGDDTVRQPCIKRRSGVA